MEAWDFFNKAESNRHHPHDGETREYRYDLPDGLSLRQAIDVAYQRGLPRGTHRSGIFEVQGPRGIYQYKEHNKIDLTTPGKVAKVTFKSWQALEVDFDMVGVALPKSELL